MSKARPIIVIDDDTDDSELIVKCLHGLNEQQVLTFPSGSAALDYLTTTTDQPHFILCDINMPVMSGIDLSKAIEELPSVRDKRIPFIFLSATVQPASIQEAMSYKVQGFFVKPAFVSELVELLKVILLYWQKAEHPSKQKRKI